jgi:hypothetical protein
MGLQHGAAFADMIPVAVKRFALDRGWNTAHGRKVIRQVERNLDRVFPESNEEMHAIASAANVDYDDLLAYNACQEIGRSRVECTNVALAETPQGTIHFKSNDVDEDMKQFHVLQETHPDKGLAFVGVTYVGTTWLNAGVNEAGLTYGGSSIPNNDSDWENGIPANTFLRYLLQYADSVDAAADLIARTPIMNHGINLMLTDPSGAAIVVERSSTRVAVRRMESHAIWNTNHFLTDEMQPVLKNDGGAAAQNSRDRFTVLERLTAEQPHSLDQLMRIARTHTEPADICRHDALAQSIMGYIMIAQERTLMVSAGYPCENEFEAFTFTKAPAAAAP